MCRIEIIVQLNSLSKIVLEHENGSTQLKWFDKLYKHCPDGLGECSSGPVGLFPK